MKRELIADILAMPLGERIRLAEAIWDSIAAKPNEIPLTDWQREELDRRLADMEANPSDKVPMHELFDRLLKK